LGVPERQKATKFPMKRGRSVNFVIFARRQDQAVREGIFELRKSGYGVGGESESEGGGLLAFRKVPPNLGVYGRVTVIQ
jgi:hypothetical protein